MPGKIARSAPQPPFGLPAGAGSRPRLACLLREGRKNANIYASSEVIWGIPDQVLPFLINLSMPKKNSLPIAVAWCGPRVACSKSGSVSQQLDVGMVRLSSRDQLAFENAERGEQYHCAVFTRSRP